MCVFLQVGCQYEFDYQVELVELSARGRCHIDRHTGPKYVVVRPANDETTEQWKDCLHLVYGSVLDSTKIKKAFLRAVETAISFVRFPSGWAPDTQAVIVDSSHYLIGKTPTHPTGINKPICVKMNGPAILVGLQYNEDGSSGDKDNEEARAKRNHDSDFVSVDLAPSIRIAKRREYFRDRFLAESCEDWRFSFLKHVMECDDIPLYIVCSKTDVSLPSHLWRLSCSCMEAALIQVSGEYESFFSSLKRGSQLLPPRCNFTFNITFL